MTDVRERLLLRKDQLLTEIEAAAAVRNANEVDELASDLMKIEAAIGKYENAVAEAEALLEKQPRGRPRQKLG